MYRTPTLWNQYYGYVVVTGVAFAGQTVLLTLLLVHRARRRRVERALRASQAALRASEATARASYAEVQDLAGRLITAQESERRRIARDLHDDLSQKLAAVGIDFERLVSRGMVSPVALGDAARELSARMATIASDVHRLSYDLHPARLEIIGLVSAIDGLCREMSLQHDIRVEFRHAVSDHRLPPDASLCLFRIVQEALHNLVKHSGATTAIVRLQPARSGLRLHIADEGRGFNQRVRSRDGLGLLSMRERVMFAGGTIAIRSAEGHGTHIVVTLPISSRAADRATQPDRAHSA
jgi:signal transduction histidine kinase